MQRTSLYLIPSAYHQKPNQPKTTQAKAIKIKMIQRRIMITDTIMMKIIYLTNHRPVTKYDKDNLLIISIRATDYDENNLIIFRRVTDYDENNFHYLQTGHTALQRAAAGGHLDIARLLVTQGASLDHQHELVIMIIIIIIIIIMMMTIMVAVLMRSHWGQASTIKMN